MLGGTQSLHTNSFDEAIALPTEKAARLALRTQQVIAYETDVTKTVDPFAGSYVVESMTDDIEEAALALIQRVEDLGGAVAAIEQGFQKSEIERSAYRVQLEIDSGERIVVGVNRFTLDQEERYEPLRVDPTIEAEQRARLEALRAERDDDAVDGRPGRAPGGGPRHRQRALPDEGGARARATGGEVATRCARLGRLPAPRDLLSPPGTRPGPAGYAAQPGAGADTPAAARLSRPRPRRAGRAARCAPASHAASRPALKASPHPVASTFVDVGGLGRHVDAVRDPPGPGRAVGRDDLSRVRRGSRPARRAPPPRSRWAAAGRRRPPRQEGLDPLALDERR